MGIIFLLTLKIILKSVKLEVVVTSILITVFWL